MIATNRVVRACFLTLLILSLAATMPMRAQEKPASAEQKQSSSDASPHSVGPSREAGPEKGESSEKKAEEEDETAAFKQSESVRYIARKLHMSPASASLLFFVLNFLVIAVIFFWAGRKYLPGMFRDRTAVIQKAMQEAQKTSEEARRKLAAIESRLMKLDVEIGMMRDAMEREAVGEEARIQAVAQEDARKIIAAAEQEIAAAAKAARRQLTAQAADLAVGLAQKQIRVDAATDQALVRNFAQELGTSENSGKEKN